MKYGIKLNIIIVVLSLLSQNRNERAKIVGLITDSWSNGSLQIQKTYSLRKKNLELL